MTRVLLSPEGQTLVWTSGGLCLEGAEVGLDL